MKTKALSWSHQTDIKKITRALRAGEVVVGTTDTVLGLFADVTQQGFERLNVIKGRHEKPYLILIETIQKASLFAHTPRSSLVEKLMTHAWPGPLTLILKARGDAPEYLRGKNNTVALRMPDHVGMISLLKNFNGLFSTSANKAGKPAPQSWHELDADIRAQAAYCINGSTTNNLASTILDCTKDEIVVVREGAYAIAELEKIGGKRLKNL